MKQILLFYFFGVIQFGIIIAQQKTSTIPNNAYNSNIVNLTNRMLPSNIDIVPFLQTPKWNKGMKINLDGTQSTLINWASGGASSISIRGFFEAFLTRRVGYITWSNDLTMGYGVIKQKGNMFAQKTDDRIDFLSNLGYYIDPYNSITAMLNFRTQFANGYSGNDINRTKISSFMAPGYFVLSLGWTYRPSEIFNVFASPLSGRFTSVSDTFLANKGAYGVDTGKLVRTELGFFIRGFFQTNTFNISVLKNIGVKSIFEMFVNYLSRQKGFYFNWETDIGFKVNSYITCNVNISFRYDQAILFPEQLADGTIRNIPKLQFKELLSLGFTYDFEEFFKKIRLKPPRS